MSARTRGAAAGLLAALAACGGEPPIPAAEVTLRVDTVTEPVESGRAFPLRVVRAWRKDLVPAPFGERSLRPLTLVREAVELEEGATHVQETLTFRAYAFARGEVTLPPLTFAARQRDGGQPRVTSVPGRVLAVRPTLAAEAPGDPELPDLAPAPRARSWAWLAAAAAALAALWLARRGRPSAPAPVAPSPDAAAERAAALARARERIERLASEPAADAEARAERLLEAARTVRAALALEDVGTLARTARELGMRAKAIGDRRGRLAARLVLAPAERVTFAREAPDALRLGRVLAAALSVLADEGRR